MNNKNLLEGDNFNQWYQVEVENYLQTLQSSSNNIEGYLEKLKIPGPLGPYDPKPLGSVTIYRDENEGTTICLSKGDRYQIPSEIKALLLDCCGMNNSNDILLPLPKHILEKIHKFKNNLPINNGIIQKPHAYGLKLSFAIQAYNSEPQLDWHELRIRQINGLELEDLNDEYILECGECQKDLNIDYQGRWIITKSEPYFHVLKNICPKCYQEEKFGDHAKDQFQFFHIGEFNFFDWIPFMTEPDLDDVVSGSTFYVNCNPQSKDWGKIMVTVCDNHGRQAFHVHYQNLNELLKDIKNWIKFTPSQFNNIIPKINLIDFYQNDFYDGLEFEKPEDDLKFDQELEIEKDRRRYEEFLDQGFDDWDHQSLMKNSVKYGLLKEGEDHKLTKRFVWEHRNVLKVLSQEDQITEMNEKIEQIKEFREKALYQRKSNEYYKKTGKFLPGVHSNSILGCDHYADLSEEEIPKVAQEELEKMMQQPVFDNYKIRKIEEQIRELGVYRHDCFKSFTLWHRLRDDLGFYWG